VGPPCAPQVAFVDADRSGACKCPACLRRCRDMSTPAQRQFEAFYESEKDRCLRALTASTGDQMLAEDLIAEALARARSNWPHVQRQPNPAAYGVRTAYNLNVSWWRRHRRERPPSEALEATHLDDVSRIDSAALLPPSQSDNARYWPCASSLTSTPARPPMPWGSLRERSPPTSTEPPRVCASSSPPTLSTGTDMDDAQIHTRVEEDFADLSWPPAAPPSRRSDAAPPAELFRRPEAGSAVSSTGDQGRRKGRQHTEAQLPALSWRWPSIRRGPSCSVRRTALRDCGLAPQQCCWTALALGGGTGATPTGPIPPAGRRR